MSQSTWMVPLNIHHSLSLRSVAKSSSHLRKISSSLDSLTSSINRIERSSIELTGTANAILELLQSKEYKELTIGAMRNLLFNHFRTCKEATKEEDSLLAYSICLTSEKIINQPWFNFDLFSLVSFEEMEKASEMEENCREIMDSIQEKLSTEERNMITLFSESMDEINEARKPVYEAAEEFVRIYSGYSDYFEIKGNKIVLAEWVSGTEGGWFKESKPGRFVYNNIFTSDRDLTEISIRDALPHLNPRKSKPSWREDWNLHGKDKAWKSISQSYHIWKRNYDNHVDLEKRLIEYANNAFEGRIHIQRTIDNLNGGASGETAMDSKPEPIGFHDFQEYSQLRVKTHKYSSVSNIPGEAELKEFLLSIIDSDPDWFWTIELADTEEFIWSEGDLFEYWRDGEKIIGEEIPPIESVEKVFREFLS